MAYGAGLRGHYRSRARTWLGFSGSAEKVMAAFGVELRPVSLRWSRALRQCLRRLPSRGAGAGRAGDRRVGRRQAQAVRQSQAPRQRRERSPRAVARRPGDHLQHCPVVRERDQRGRPEIGIPGQSALTVSDVQTFRSTFGLPKNDPQTILVPGYPDPGKSDANGLGEALLDVEYSGAIAPAATIILRLCAQCGRRDASHHRRESRSRDQLQLRNLRSGRFGDGQRG